MMMNLVYCDYGLWILNVCSYPGDDYAVGFFTFASMFDILSIGSSCYSRENDRVVRLCFLCFLAAKPRI